MLKMFVRYREIVLGILILVVISEKFVVSLDTACDDWDSASYKDENSPTLAIVHSKEEQDFLANYLFKILKKVDNFWIGAKSTTSSSFKWVDNSEMTFSNWVKAPKNKTNYCVQMQSEEDVVGKWTDEPCEKRNAAVCQKMQTRSIAKLQKSHLEARKEFKEALDEANKKIAEMKQNLIPVGFLYTQLPNEKPPASIWPWMNWTNLSSAYSGVFFRAEGGDSAPFGHTQNENDWRVVLVELEKNNTNIVYNNATIGANTFGQKTMTSDWIYTGDNAMNIHYYSSLRFVTTTGENRPRNMAIRIWKRSG